MRLSMVEVYELRLSMGALVFVNGVENMPQWALQPRFDPAKAETGVSLECRMGDPDLIHCAVFRTEGKPGGIFTIFNGNTLLYAALAQSELVFSIATGYFGQLTANVRYGVDVFENMEIPND